MFPEDNYSRGFSKSMIRVKSDVVTIETSSK